jgi:hypothetical protein
LQVHTVKVPERRVVLASHVRVEVLRLRKNLTVRIPSHSKIAWLCGLRL